MKAIDHTLENLLDLDGERIVVDDSLGLWVKFEVKKTVSRHQGIRYSLTLHNKNNKRIMGFDNSHEIEYGAKKVVSPKEPMITGILMKMILADRINILMPFN